MAGLDRRTFLTTVSMAGLTSLAPTAVAAPAVQGQSTAPPATAPTGVTRTLAQYVLSVRADDLPDSGAKGSTADAAQLGGMRGRRIATRDR